MWKTKPCGFENVWAWLPDISIRAPAVVMA
jgi:hypothetical protein